jgi:hypothetical protein
MNPGKKKDTPLEELCARLKTKAKEESTEG